MMMVYCSAPSVKYTYDVAMVRTDGSQKQAAALLYIDRNGVIVANRLMVYTLVTYTDT